MLRRQSFWLRRLPPELGFSPGQAVIFLYLASDRHKSAIVGNQDLPVPFQMASNRLRQNRFIQRLPWTLDQNHPPGWRGAREGVIIGRRGELVGGKKAAIWQVGTHPLEMKQAANIRLERPADFIQEIGQGWIISRFAHAGPGGIDTVQVTQVTLHDLQGPFALHSPIASSKKQ